VLQPRNGAGLRHTSFHVQDLYLTDLDLPRKPRAEVPGVKVLQFARQVHHVVCFANSYNTLLLQQAGCNGKQMAHLNHGDPTLASQQVVVKFI